LEGERAGTVKGSRGGPRENQGKTLATVSYEAEVAEISATFQRKLAGLRRRLPSWEIPAAVRALKEEKQAALKALSDRRSADQHSKRENRRRLRFTPPGSAPT
jgi:hypothetical protein